MQLDLARKNDELAFQKTQLDKQAKEIISLKGQFGESRDTYLNLKRENTELLIEKRAMESDIADKLKTIATVEKEKAELEAQSKAQENQLSLQEEALAEFKQLNEQSQMEFDILKEELDLRNATIEQLKE